MPQGLPIQERWRWLILGILVCTGPIVILAHGLLGAGSATTAVVLILSTGAFFAVGDWSVRPNVYDLCFLGFVACISLSLLEHPADLKEIALLAITLVSYPAGRLFRPKTVNPVFSKFVLLTAAVGGVLILIALLRGQVDINGKPQVFGEFAAAPAQFMIPFVLAIGAIAARDKPDISFVPTALIVVMAVIFAAAMVRFTFIAAAGAGVILAMVSSKHTRRLATAATVVLVVAVLIGQAARPATATVFRNFATQAFSFSAPSDACANLDINNTIQIRGALYREWARLAPEAGLTGIGLNEFEKRSCYHAGVHNDLLQIALEFGWPAAGLFSLLLVVAFANLVQARRDEQARFGLFALAFLAIMSTAHGRVTGAGLLLFFTGFAISVGAPRASIREPS